MPDSLSRKVGNMVLLPWINRHILPRRLTFPDVPTYLDQTHNRV